MHFRYIIPFCIPRWIEFGSYYYAIRFNPEYLDSSHKKKSVLGLCVSPLAMLTVPHPHYRITAPVAAEPTMDVHQIDSSHK